MNQAISKTATNSDIKARYQRAQLFLQGAYGLRKLALNTSLVPHWIGHSDCFWYEHETPSGKSFHLVDARQQSNAVAFDHDALASALTKESGEAVDPNNLPLNSLTLDLESRAVEFSAFGKAWVYDAQTQRCETSNAPVCPGTLSPDGKTSAFVRDHNVWIHQVEEKK